MPQLRRVDDIEIPAVIGFGVDNEMIHLPKSAPHCVPEALQGFLKDFIDKYYGLFDKRDRSDLQVCYDDNCLLSICIAPTENAIVPTKSFKFGKLIYESRNFKKIFDDNKRMTLLRHGKTSLMDFLRVVFPPTKHDGNSFHVDVLSTTNNRAVFSVNGLFKETDQSTNAPVRSFHRTFTCCETPLGILIVADHIMIMNATDAQIANMNRSAPPTTTSVPTSSQGLASQSVDAQTQMIQRFSEQSGMNFEYSKLCLCENGWDYEKAAHNFQQLKSSNSIPLDAFKKP